MAHGHGFRLVRSRVQHLMGFALGCSVVIFGPHIDPAGKTASVLENASFGIQSTYAKENRSGADLALAKQFFNLGKTYYQQGAYEKALSAFEQSYQHSTKAALLYNIAKCHEALGQLESAVNKYEAFLRDSETSNPSVRARIGNLRARIARSRSNKAPSITTTSPAAAKQDGATATVASKSARGHVLSNDRDGGARRDLPALPEHEAASTPRDRNALRDAHQAKRMAPNSRSPALTFQAQPPRQAANESARNRANWMPWAGWALIGLGSASIVASIALGLGAASKADLLEEAYACGANPSNCPTNGQPYDWAQVEDSIESKGKSLQSAQVATLIGGLIAAGGGVTLLLVAPRKHERKVANLTPLIAPRLIGVSASTRF